MSPIISIIIPVYKVEEFIEKCLTSVMTQTFTNFEALVIDDGSPDDSISIAKRTVGQDSRFIFFKKENGGLPSARNFGLDHAQGDYIVFLDSDDYIVNTFLENMYTQITQKNADICVCDIHYVKNDNIIRTYYCSPEAYYQKNDFLLCLQTIPAFAWAKIYKTSLFDHMRYDESVKTYEDSHFTFRLIYNKKIVHEPKPLLFYVQREGSITQSLGETFFTDKKAIYQAFEQFMQDKKLGNEYHEYLLYAYFSAYCLGSAIVIARFSNSFKADMQYLLSSIDKNKFTYRNIFKMKKYNVLSTLSLLLLKLSPNLFKLLLKIRDFIQKK